MNAIQQAQDAMLSQQYALLSFTQYKDMKAENAALKEQVAFWKEEQMAQVVRTNEEITIGRELEQQLATLQSKSAALVDALEFCSGASYIDDAHRVADEALAAFKGEK